MKPRPPRRIEVGIVEQVERGLHACERGAACLGQRERLAVAPGRSRMRVGDVVEEQHEPRHRRTFRRGVAHRRHVHPDEMTRVRGCHEARRRGRRAVAPGDPALDGFAGVGDQRGVDRPVDPAAEADRLGARRCARLPAEELARPLVVKQDPTVEIADHHALVQLGHERAELVALSRHAAARLVHQAPRLAVERATGAREAVDRLGQRTRGAAGGCRQIGRVGVADKHLRRVREPKRLRDIARMQTRHGPGRKRRRREPPHDQQHPVRPDERSRRLREGRATRGVRRRP